MARFVSVLLVILTFASCIPIRLSSGDTPGSRDNLGEKVPDFIVAGRTTMADVLLELGEPEGNSKGNTFYYTRLTREEGISLIYLPALAGVSYETITTRRLTVHFDKQGLVEDVRFEKLTCKTLPGHTVDYPPCVKTSSAK